MPLASLAQSVQLCHPAGLVGQASLTACCGGGIGCVQWVSGW